MGEILNLNTEEDAMIYLDAKTKNIFQEYSLKIFQFTDEFYANLIFEQYMPICKEIIESYTDDEDEDYMELMDEAVNSDDFKNFVKHLHKIVLHISLSDPPITLDLVPHRERIKKSDIFDQYELKKFKKSEMFCIDGFPKEELPAVVVYPPPMKGKYVYQGIKPSVITLPEADDEILEYIKNLKVVPKPSKSKIEDNQDNKKIEKSAEKNEVNIVKIKPEIIEIKADNIKIDEAPELKIEKIIRSSVEEHKTQKELTPVVRDVTQSDNESVGSEHKMNLKAELGRKINQTSFKRENILIGSDSKSSLTGLIEPNEATQDNKERVISPVPKERPKVKNTASINIKNAKNDVLASIEIESMKDVTVMDDVGSFNNFKEDIDGSIRVEGSTRFADLATKSITKLDSHMIMKSPTN
jgi:hypothetical protein